MGVFSDNDLRQTRVSSLEADCVSFFELQKDESAIIASSFEKLINIFEKNNVDLTQLFEQRPYEYMVFEGGQFFEDYNTLLSILKGTFSGAGSTSGVISGLSATVSASAYVGSYVVLRNAAIQSLLRDIGQGVIPRTIRWLPTFGRTGRLLGNEMNILRRGVDIVPYFRPLRSIGRIGGRVFLVAGGLSLVFDGIAALIEKGQLIEAIRLLAQERVKYYYGLKTLSALRAEVEGALKAAQALSDIGALHNETAKKLFGNILKKVDETIKELQKNIVTDLNKRDKNKGSNPYLTDDPKEFDLSFLKEQTPRLKKIKIRSGWVVDSIECETTDDEQSIKYGGNRGEYSRDILLDHDEYIVQIKWRNGKYQEKNVITDLYIQTSKSVYGPFGNKTTEVSAGPEIIFNTQKEFRVVRLVDFDAKLSATNEKPVWEMPEYISNLKMEVRRVY